MLNSENLETCRLAKGKNHELVTDLLSCGRRSILLNLRKSIHVSTSGGWNPIRFYRDTDTSVRPINMSMEMDVFR